MKLFNLTVELVKSLSGRCLQSESSVFNAGASIQSYLHSDKKLTSTYIIFIDMYSVHNTYHTYDIQSYLHSDKKQTSPQ